MVADDMIQCEMVEVQFATVFRHFFVSLLHLRWMVMVCLSAQCAAVDW